MKITPLYLDEKNGIGIEAIALVAEPAIEENFMAFSRVVPRKKNRFEFAVSDTEQHIITGPALVPNKMIYRFYPETQSEEYVYFTKGQVKLASEMYLKAGLQSSINIEHASPVAGVTLVESWIVNDPACDKSIALGYKGLSKGTWMVSMKVDNEAVWNDLIKSGKTQGFSIEGMFISKLMNAPKKDDEVK